MLKRSETLICITKEKSHRIQVFRPNSKELFKKHISKDVKKLLIITIQESRNKNEFSGLKFEATNWIIKFKFFATAVFVMS